MTKKTHFKFGNRRKISYICRTKFEQALPGRQKSRPQAGSFIEGTNLGEVHTLPIEK